MSIFEFCHLMIRAKITNWVLLLSKIIHLKQLKNQLQLQSSNSFKFNKFQKIIDICLELAYKPWSLRASPIFLQNIMKGVDSWSKQELGQAFVLIAFYHSLCQ